MLAQTAPVSQRGETGSAQQHQGMMRLLGALQHLLRARGGGSDAVVGEGSLNRGPDGLEGQKVRTLGFLSLVH